MAHEVLEIEPKNEDSEEKKATKLSIFLRELAGKFGLTLTLGTKEFFLGFVVGNILSGENGTLKSNSDVENPAKIPVRIKPI